MLQRLHCGRCDAPVSGPVRVAEIKARDSIAFDLSVEAGDPACAKAYAIEVERVAPRGFVYPPARRTMQQYHLHPLAVIYDADWHREGNSIQFEDRWVGLEVVCTCGGVLGGFVGVIWEEEDMFISNETMTNWKSAEQ